MSAAFDWRLAGKVEPVTIGSDQLLGDRGATRAVPPMASLSHFDERYAFKQGLTICRAYRKPFHNQVLLGDAGVALFDGGKIVGTGAKGHIFLLPEYRGDELATEMMAEFYAAYPTVMHHRLEREFAQTFTPEGRATCHRAYEMLVDRKAIVDPTKLRRAG
jgi:hypothetical protein